MLSLHHGIVTFGALDIGKSNRSDRCYEKRGGGRCRMRLQADSGRQEARAEHESLCCYLDQL